MSNVFAIAQKELRSYFASPVGYIITGLFAHSTHSVLHPVARIRESLGFVRLLDRALGAVKSRAF